MILNFEAMLPEIEERSRLHFSHLDPDAREEAIAESVAMVFQMYKSCRRRGNARWSPRLIIRHANRNVDAGRRMAGCSSRDALDRAISLEELDAEGPEPIGRTLAAYAYPDPLEAARQKLDGAMFAQLLTEQERDIVKMLCDGWRRWPRSRVRPRSEDADLRKR